MLLLRRTLASRTGRWLAKGSSSRFISSSSSSPHYDSSLNSSKLVLAKENMKFSAGHFTVFDATSRERLHGHNHAVRLEITHAAVDDTTAREGESAAERNGMVVDYNVYKSAIRRLCDDWDEYMLLPLSSPYLRIHTCETENTVSVSHGDRPVAVFQQSDVRLLPIENTTLEELSRLMLTRFVDAMADTRMDGESSSSFSSASPLLDVLRKIEVFVSNGTQQSSYTWENPLTPTPTHTHAHADSATATATDSVTATATDMAARSAVAAVQGDAPSVADDDAGGGKGFLVVTGASKGIGYAIAKLFIANGYSVVNLSRGECSLSGVHNISCDLSDVEGVSRVGKQVAAWLADQNPDSKPVHLVNNAGTYTVDSTRGSIDWRAFQRVMDVNVTAPAVLTAELADALLGAKQASVVYIGSTLSEQSIANGASYCTSKHALVGLMRATTQDFFHTNTHSVCVCPGFVGTDMMQANVDGMDVDAKDAFLSQMAFKRLLDPAEIAKLTLFAAENQMMNGAVLHANLGQGSMKRVMQADEDIGKIASNVSVVMGACVEMFLDRIVTHTQATAQKKGATTIDVETLVECFTSEESFDFVADIAEQALEVKQQQQQQQEQQQTEEKKE